MAYQLVQNDGSPPANAVIFGNQTDSGDMYIAVANTEWGNIPGKAQGNTCWFPYNGRENQTSDFKWLVAPHYALSLEKAQGRGPPQNGLHLGLDSSGIHYLAVADSPWGRIPGKAQGDTCWYSYGGNENTTPCFEWIVTRQFESVFNN